MRETTVTAMFVNLPVTDLDRAKAFYTAIGFTINPLFTDHNAACVVVGDGHGYFMILVREFVQTFNRPTDRRPEGESVGRDRDFLRQPGGGRRGRCRRPRRGRRGDAPRHGLRLHVPASAHRPRRQRHRVRLNGPGRRRAGSRGLHEPAGLRSMAAREYGQYCGITRALELVGERWALLIVRDLLVGPRRYGELAAGLPRIPSNILAARLKELQAAGVIRRAPRSRVIV